MKRFILVSAVVFLWAHPLQAAESVLRFDTVIDVRADSTIEVTETVVYDMGGMQRHGWERIIPKQSGGGPRDVIADVDARRNGAADPVTVTDDGDRIIVRIGDPDRTITGVHTYTVSYTVQNEVRYFTDRDEVYWNAIPQDLRLPVLESAAVMNLPDGAVVAGAYCYTGPSGSTASECSVTSEASSVSARADRAFGPQEGMSVAVAVHPGVIARVAPAEEAVSFSALVPILFSVASFAGLCVLIVAFWIVVFRKGGLPRRRSDGGDIVVQYDPPSGCTAPAAAYIASPSMTGRIFTAGVVQLAVEKWLTMHFSHEKKLFGTRTEILFKRARDGHPDDPTLHQVMDALFIVGPERTLSDLRRDARLGAAPVNAIAAGIPLHLKRDGIIASTGLGSFLRRYTPAGTAMREHLAGLKTYLGAAEKERLAFHHAPEHSPQTFERLLPYAIALGVDEPWTAAFGDLRYTPEWTSGDSTVVGMAALTEGLHDLSTGAQSVMNAYASGTGGGGGGGGGSSGGGGGGGGGGGW